MMEMHGSEIGSIRKVCSPRFGLKMITRTALGALALGGVTTVGFAQEGSANASASQRSVDEIIVTAARREQNLSDVPASITALSGDYLSSLGFDNFSDYAGLAPSLDFVEFAPGQTRITIRGISADPSFTTASTVSVYIDDVPMTSSNAGTQVDFRLYDVNRVEVLRGPQGTLYGENSMGGAIRIFTNEPDTSDFSASAEVGFGSLKDGGTSTKVDGMVNFPIVADKVALRVVGSYRKSGGWIENVTLGTSDVNESEVTAVRAALKITPTDNLEITLRASANQLEVDSSNETTLSTRSTDATANSPSEDDYEIYSADVDWNFGFATLESVTSFSHRESATGSSEASVGVDFQNSLFVTACIFTNPTCTAPDTTAFLTSSIFLADLDQDIWTQELRLVSPSDQPLRWIVGGFYTDSDLKAGGHRETTPVARFANDLYLPLGFSAGDAVPGGFLADTGITEKTAYALFGEVSYDLTDKLEITGGLRWFGEEFDYLPVESSGLITFFGSGTSFVAVGAPFSAKAEDTNVKAIISYKPNDDMHFYASFTEGFRSGGANFFSSADPNFQPEYDPDTTQNYEIGGKFQFADGRINLSTALFYINWEDLQVQQFDIGTGQGFTTNGGTAHVAGIEAEFTGDVTEHLTLTLSGNLTEAETDEAFVGSFAPMIPEGTRLPNVPIWTYGASIDYVYPLPNREMDVVARFDVHGQGSTYSGLERRPQFFGTFPLSPNRSLQDSYHIGNFRTGVETDNWSLLFYVENVWDEVADLGDNNFGRFHRNQPRTIGLVASAKFR